ncbi:hypothetical protein ABPG72_021738 [Tetrahymena utriculariae]
MGSTSDFVKGLIVSYMDIGYSSRETSNKIGSLIGRYNTNKQMINEQLFDELQVSHSTCANIFKQFKEELSYADNRKHNGREAIYNEVEQQNMVGIVEEKIGISFKEIVNDKTINPKEASRVTIQTILKENDIKCYRQPQIIHLSEQQRSSRLMFAQQTKLWKQNWQRILFSDESQITMNPNNNFYYAKSKDQIPLDLMKNKQSYPLKIHVWGIISSTAPLNLELIEGNLNSNGYLNLIQNYFNNNQNRLPKDFIFQQDNSRVHTAQIITNFLTENNINTLEWPSGSPDLSPIENVWSVIKEELWSFKAHIKNTNDLYSATTEIFFNSPTVKQAISNSYLSLPKRIQQLIKLNGEQIRDF